MSTWATLDLMTEIARIDRKRVSVVLARVRTVEGRVQFIPLSTLRRGYAV
jgi:hypothetical protein